MKLYRNGSRATCAPIHIGTMRMGMSASLTLATISDTATPDAPARSSTSPKPARSAHERVQVWRRDA